MDIVTVKITGLDEFQKVLDRLAPAVSKRLLRKAMRNAANVWREEIVRRAPRLAKHKQGGTNPKKWRYAGELAGLIGMKSSTPGNEMEGTVRVGPTRRPFWALFLEFGTRKMRARPFIRPAYESKKAAVLAKFVEEGRKIVAAEAGKSHV